MIPSESRFLPTGAMVHSPWSGSREGLAQAQPVATADGFIPSGPPPPADPRALAVVADAAAAPETTSVAHRGLRVAMLAGLALAGLVGMSGCSAPPPPVAGVSQATAGVPIDVTQATKDPGYVRLSIDPMSGARLDIHRETESHTDTDSDGSSHSHTTEVDLSPYGVNLGNGLFYDAHGNLTFNPYTALRGEPLPQAENVRIEGFLSGQTLQRSGGDTALTGTLGLTARIQGDRLERPGLATDLTVTREGNTTVLHRGALTTDVRITQEGNRTTIRRGLLSTPWTITRDGNQITIDRGALTPSTTIDLWQDAARMKQLWSTTEVSAGPGQVTIDRPGLGATTHIQEGQGTLTLETGLARQTWTAR